MADYHRIDENEFEDARLKAREASKGEKKTAAAQVKLDVHDIGRLQKMNDVSLTDDSAKFGRENITTNVKAIYYSRQFHSSSENVPEGEQLGVILSRTNFYAESGGQENDTGKIIIDGIAELEVSDVQSFAGYILHTGTLKYGNLSVGDDVICEYDEIRRWPIRNNHSGTHLLNFALREILGAGIDQRGSLVAQEKLRFDFSHKSSVSDSELQRVEAISNDYIRQACLVYAKDVPLATAREIQGVRAVFGETYPDPVRVVSIGVEVDELLKDVKSERWNGVSIEFCKSMSLSNLNLVTECRHAGGGTHVAKTSDIRDLVILEESGIAKGIRRIIAVTGDDAHAVQRVAEAFEERIAKLEKMPGGAAKDAEIKAVKLELGPLAISAVTKTKLRERFSKIEKAQLDEQKAQQKLESKKAQDTVNEYFLRNEGKKQAVIELPISANSKAVGEVLNFFKTKSKEKSVYVFAADPEGKVIHGCYVADVSHLLTPRGIC